MRDPFIRPILQRLAPRLGAEVEFHPDGYVGWIRFASGRRSLFWDNKFNLNSVSSAKIAQDKAYSSFVLKANGFDLPEECQFFRESFRDYAPDHLFGVDPAIAYAKSLGFPVFVKPNRMSQGRLIEKVFKPAELRRAAAEIFAVNRSLLVQRPCSGKDYRLIVLDGTVISAYERVPLTVIGDGTATLRTLLKRRQSDFQKEGRDTVIRLADQRMNRRLRHEGMSLRSVPEPGVPVRLLDAANLSLGGTTEDCTANLHPSFAALAAKVAEVMDLRLAGVDLMAEDATRPLEKYTLLEVNSAPGLDNYLFTGEQNRDHVDRLYLSVLRAVEAGPPRVG